MAEFIVTCPAFILVDRATTKPDESTRLSKISGYGCNVFSGQEYVMIFTDQDLGARFVREKNLEGVVLGALDTPQQWLGFLESVARNGGRYVGFDPRADGTPVELFTVDKVMRSLRDHLGKQGTA